MRRNAAIALVGATVVAAALFGARLDSTSGALAAAGIAAATWALVAERPSRWGLRTALALVLVALSGWTIVSWRVRDLSRAGPDEIAELEEKATDRLAAELRTRLRQDRALAERVARGLEARAARAGREMTLDPALFRALGEVVPAGIPDGIGIEVYGPSGHLRAWWGDPRGETLPPDSVSTAVAGVMVRKPAGHTIAYSGVPWIVGRDSFRVIVKDVWALESPLALEVGERDLLLARLGRRLHLEFEVRPVGGNDAVGGTTLAGPRGSGAAVIVPRRLRLDVYASERRASRARLLALLLVWPLLWSVGALWHEARAWPRRTIGSRWGRWALAVGSRAAVLAAAWLFLVENRFLARLLPQAWFSPVGFGTTAFGPASRSPGDWVVTAVLVLVLALTAWALLPRESGEENRLRWAVGALTVGIASIGTARLTIPALERALGSMSPEEFFAPTLLFSPPLLMVLLGFALVAAVAVIVFAIVARVVDAPTGSGWIGALVAAVAASLAFAAWRVPEAAMAGHRTEIALPVAAALAASGWLAAALARTRYGLGPATIRLGLLAAALGALSVLPLAAVGRVEAAHELLVERAQRIGRASSQWLDYTMSRTVEFLSEEPDVAEAIAGENRDAALSLWSRSPLSELDFATGLYLFDERGRVVSRFSLAARDLVDRARGYAAAVEPAQIAVQGTQGTGPVRWAVVPVQRGGARIGTAVAMTTGALELRERAPGAAFVLTDLLAGAGLEPDLPGYTTLGPGETVPPRTLVTGVRPSPAGGARPDEGILLAMPLDPLLPGPRTAAVFALVGALAGLALGFLERSGSPRSRIRWWTRLRTENPLRSFRVQLLLAFLAVAAVPLALYAVLGYRATRLELEEATRSAAAEALTAARRLLVESPALEERTATALEARLREVSDVLQQDLVLYWRGRTVASSRPEIFASRLFADRMEGSVYARIHSDRRTLVFDETALGDRSFLVAYRPLSVEGDREGYVLATPLLIREDRVRVELQRLGEGVFLLSAFSIVFLLVVGWGLARFMARPLSELERGTRQIAAGNLSYRLSEPARRDEIGRLQRAFNAMGERLSESQRALEREKSRVQAILASVGAGVVALDEEGRVRLINDRAAALLGESPEEVVARSASDLARRRDGAAEEFWRVVAWELDCGERGDRDLVLRRDGEERHFHVVCTGLRDAGGEERGVVVAFEDITENVQSQRVLAWGEMARQVAHEIKNPLTPMKLSLQHLERTVEDVSPGFERLFRENLELILAEIDRLERIAGSFARFAVPHPGELEPFDAVDIARDALALFAPGEEGVEYHFSVKGQPRPLLGEPEGFRRILVNLLQNSRDAVLAAGEGRVEVVLDWTGDPRWARVSVLDEGVGFPQEEVERLFEPSFSTKSGGTGLGLAITRRIVEAWGGEIAWERLDSGGAAIHLRLRTEES
ncbi:MAG: ATP-binding protein [Gemmatimonadota bacterium]|nr:ATP-binding protein [Gemmatimonadota bacterium]